VFRPKGQPVDGKAPDKRTQSNQLAEQYLSLVIQIARGFRRLLPPGVDVDDLVGAGNLGLVEAARRFDPARGTSFHTFATHRIRGAIRDSLRQADPISRSLRSHQKGAERVARELTTRLLRYPTEAETARALHISLRCWQERRLELNSAGCPVNGDSMKGGVATTDADQLPGTWADPEQQATLAETRQILGNAMKTLAPRYRYVIQLYHFEEWTMKQIGTKLGVDESRISQIRAAALAQLQGQLAPPVRQPE
jgi:RNA polymerase sigma factor FliA